MIAPLLVSGLLLTSASVLAEGRIAGPYCAKPIEVSPEENGFRRIRYCPDEATFEDEGDNRVGFHAALEKFVRDSGEPLARQWFLRKISLGFTSKKLLVSASAHSVPGGRSTVTLGSLRRDQPKTFPEPVFQKIEIPTGAPLNTRYFKKSASENDLYLNVRQSGTVNFMDFLIEAASGIIGEELGPRLNGQFRDYTVISEKNLQVRGFELPPGAKHVVLPDLEPPTSLVDGCPRDFGRCLAIFDAGEEKRGLELAFKAYLSQLPLGTRCSYSIPVRTEVLPRTARLRSQTKLLINGRIQPGVKEEILPIDSAVASLHLEGTVLLPELSASSSDHVRIVITLQEPGKTSPFRGISIGAISLRCVKNQN